MIRELSVREDINVNARILNFNVWRAPEYIKNNETLEQTGASYNPLVSDDHWR
jgi:hypothetical protein